PQRQQRRAGERVRRRDQDHPRGAAAHRRAHVEVRVALHGAQGLMTMFDAISTAGTGLNTYHTWLDVIANNVANMNDTAPTSGNVFTTHYAQAASIAGSGGIGEGVQIASVTESSGNGILVQDALNP